MEHMDANETLTRVGPGTPMGKLLRWFWVPALLEDEVAEPDGDPVELRLFGEDLVAFRDTEGRIGILDRYCPHRRVSLWLGRNEECGLRCVYHGWKFDVAGNCVDQPSEAPENVFKDKVKTTSYPTVVRGGVVWTYMGPKGFEPEPPGFEWSVLPRARRYATKRLQRCNWAQAVEGGIDSSHISFLHNMGPDPARNQVLYKDTHPIFEVKETDYGLMIGARRVHDEQNYYWRITQFLLPFYTMIPPSGIFADSSEVPYNGHAWVPIDDENCWVWSFGANPHRDWTDDERERMINRWGPIDGNYVPLGNRSNNYLIDRGVQRKGHFTGIPGLANQDTAVQESMGPVVDRSRERLGHSDRGIVNFRRLLVGLAREAASGKAPAAASHAEWYTVRSAAVVLPRDVPVAEGAARLLVGDRTLLPT
jgi:phenylpropionate dioxygenase-like ring-hydroxylating dioxygenase large terminal subunit